MDAGKAVTVNLEQYLKVLSQAGFKQDAEKLKDALSKYGIEGRTTFYQGPKVGDGQILLSYKMNGINGLLRFTENGNLYDGAMGKKIVDVSNRTGRLLIAGLFGIKELSSPLKNEFDKLLLGGILMAKGCYDTNSQKICNLKSAEKELDKAKTEETKRRNETKTEKIVRMLTLINDMKVWARKETCSLFCRVDPKDITNVMEKYELALEDVSDKGKTLKLLAKALEEMADTYTVKKYAKEKGYGECSSYSTTSSNSPKCSVSHSSCSFNFPGIKHFNKSSSSESCSERTQNPGIR